MHPVRSVSNSASRQTSPLDWEISSNDVRHSLLLKLALTEPYREAVRRMLVISMSSLSSTTGVDLRTTDGSVAKSNKDGSSASFCAFNSMPPKNDILGLVNLRAAGAAPHQPLVVEQSSQAA